MQFFYCATCQNLKPSLTIIMHDGDQYFEKKKRILMSSYCHVSDFNKWITINDVNMTSHVQL
jgi:hypothetical protein